MALAAPEVGGQSSSEVVADVEDGRQPFAVVVA